jgi:acyl-CoA synthetase (AMP-forming)/AMP-acid ligase II
MTDDWYGKTTAQQLDIIAAETPELPLLFADGQWWTASVLAAQGRTLASSLAAMGLRQGDVISTQMPNWAEAIAIDYAASALGLVINPVVLIYREAELRQILADCDAKAIFIPPSFGNQDYLAMMLALQAELSALRHVITLRGDGPIAFNALVAAGDPAFRSTTSVSADSLKMLMYTSGTTGRAKGVRHSHRTLATCTRNTAANYGLRPDDKALVLGPVGHLGGYIYTVLFPIIMRSPSAMVERWNVAEAAELVGKLQLTHATGATAFLQDIIGHARETGWDWPSLRLFACGGAAVPPRVIEDFVAGQPGRIAFRCYGMTEAPNSSMRRPGPFDLQSASMTDGYPNGFEIEARDEEGRLLPHGKEGEICMRGAALMLGYMHAEDNAKAFHPDGFFRSGDMGFIDADGNVVITGRIKDLIIRGGENISAKEIEDALQNHPAVDRVAVVGVFDPASRLGERIAGFVIPKSDAAFTREDLNAHILAAGLAKQKQLEQMFVVREFPLTPFGKIRKNLLRDFADPWHAQHNPAVLVS